MFEEWSGLEAELSLSAAGPWKNGCPAGKSLQQSGVLQDLLLVGAGAVCVLMSPGNPH